MLEGIRKPELMKRTTKFPDNLCRVYKSLIEELILLLLGEINGKYCSERFPRDSYRFSENTWRVHIKGGSFEIAPMLLNQLIHQSMTAILN